MTPARKKSTTGDENLVRTQLLLDPPLHQQLSELAEQENRSLSSLVREMLQEELRLRKRRRLERAASTLMPDYEGDSGLMAFNALDGEDFNA